MKKTKPIVFGIIVVVAVILFIRNVGNPVSSINPAGSSSSSVGNKSNLNVSSSLMPLEEHESMRVPVDIPIWYVNEGKSGLEQVTFTQDSMTPAYLFETWRSYNKLPESVTMHEFIITDNSVTTEHKDGSNSGTVSHKVATELYITIDVSAEFAQALEGDTSGLLLQSLQQTLKDNYSYAKLFLTITIEGKPLPL